MPPEPSLRVAVIDASSGPSGENPTGTLMIDGVLIGTVGCLHVDGAEARIGLDVSASIGLTALMRVSDNADPEADDMNLSPSGLAASVVCDAPYLEPGPARTGTFLVRDAAPPS